MCLFFRMSLFFFRFCLVGLCVPILLETYLSKLLLYICQYRIRNILRSMTVSTYKNSKIWACRAIVNNLVWRRTIIKLLSRSTIDITKFKMGSYRTECMLVKRCALKNHLNSCLDRLSLPLTAPPTTSWTHSPCILCEIKFAIQNRVPKL
jgi:hypothetical protein